MGQKQSAIRVGAERVITKMCDRNFTVMAADVSQAIFCTVQDRNEMKNMKRFTRSKVCETPFYCLRIHLVGDFEETLIQTRRNPTNLKAIKLGLSNKNRGTCSLSSWHFSSCCIDMLY